MREELGASASRSRRPVQAESVRLLDFYIDQAANEIIAPLKHDNLIRPRAPGEARSIRFTRTFAKYFDIATDQTLAGTARRFIYDCKQIVIACFFDRLGYLFRHFRGGCLASRRVAKYERVIKLNVFNQIACLLVIALRLTRKPNDNIGRDRDPLACSSNPMNKIDIFFRGVSAMHRLKNLV